MSASQQLKYQRLILGSASPRRKALLEAMGFEFEVRSPEIQEHYPSDLKGHHITDYLAVHKAKALEEYLDSETLLLTADTIVWFNGTVLEKPNGLDQAFRTLRQLSGHWHEVITSVCFKAKGLQKVKHACTKVKFSNLTEEDIKTYLKKGHPLDKAGSYGIQEWIGLIGVEYIRGSYTNVVGLPTQLVYKTLMDMAG